MQKTRVIVFIVAMLCAVAQSQPTSTTVIILGNYPSSSILHSVVPFPPNFLPQVQVLIVGPPVDHYKATVVGVEGKAASGFCAYQGASGTLSQVTVETYLSASETLRAK